MSKEAEVLMNDLLEVAQGSTWEWIKAEYVRRLDAAFAKVREECAERAMALYQKECVGTLNGCAGCTECKRLRAAILGTEANHG